MYIALAATLRLSGSRGWRSAGYNVHFGSPTRSTESQVQGAGCLRVSMYITAALRELMFVGSVFEDLARTTLAEVRRFGWLVGWLLVDWSVC